MEWTRLVASALAVIVLIAACGGEAAPVVGTFFPVTTIEEDASCEVGEIDGDLHVYTWPDRIDPDLIAAFEEEYAVEVLEDFYESNEELAAKLQSGAVYDLVFPSDYMVAVLADDGFLSQIQPGAVPNLANLDSRFADPAYDPGGVHSVAYAWGTIGLGVDLEKVHPHDEAGWGLVFDPDSIAEYAGGISLLDDQRQTLGAALKYLGYPINSTDPRELEEAADVIAAIAELEVRFDADGTGNILIDGEVAIAHGRSDVIGPAIHGLDRFVFLTPAEGAAIWVDTMAVTANVGHPCTAHTFIDYLLEVENSATVTNWTRLASPNAAAQGLIEPGILEDRSIYPPEGLDRLLEMIEDLGEFEGEYADYFAIARS